MLLDKWKPLYAPEGEVGADTGAEIAPAPPPMNEAPVDGPGSGRSKLRSQLEKNVETVRTRDEAAAKAPKAPQKSRARQELEEQEAEVPEQEVTEPVVEDQQTEQPQVLAPEGWAKEAKAEWEKLPPTVQAAVAKREADMAKGVDEIKKKYSEIDQALAPRMEVIRRHGHTPAQAVNQLFAWFEALSANPVQAFPALAQSFKFDLRHIPGLQQVLQQQQDPKLAQQEQKPIDPAEIPQGVQNYVKSLEQRINELKQGVSQQFTQLTSSFAQQQQAKTEEILMTWAKDKPYFDDVRKMMAHLISSQAVPPLANGSADLDKAYDMAIYALPDVRQRVIDAQKKTEDDARKAKAATEKKLQQEQADKARRAGASLTPGAPGAAVAQQGKPKGKSKSVRESIMEARQELSDN